MRNRIQAIIAIAMMAMSLPNLQAASSPGDAQPSRQTEVDASSAAEPVDDSAAANNDSAAGDSGGSDSAAPEDGGPEPPSGAAKGDGPSAMPIESDEIVVTGKLIQDTLQDTPESVAILSSDAITDAGLRELEDAYNQTANVYQVANGEGFGIRGINHNSVGTGGAGELGGYYIDGVAFTGFSKRFGPMQLWDVEQIEILRGPQTTNVGRNALAGAVLLNTRAPVPVRESAWRLGAASESTMEAAGTFNAPVSRDSAVRLSADYWTSDGFVTNPTRGEDDFDARENLTLRGKWLLQPELRDDVRALFTVQYGETRRGNDIVDLARPDERENFSNLDDFEENDSTLLALDLTLSLNQVWSLRSITSFLEADYRRFDDDDQGPGGGNSFRGRDAGDRNWAQDLRFQYAGGSVRGVSGLFYTEVELENNTRGEVNLRPTELGIPAPLLPFYPDPIIVSLDSPGLIDTTNLAFFTRWDWDLSERWSAFAGLRFDREEQTSDLLTRTSLRSSLPDPASPGLPPEVAGAIAAINALLESQIGSSSALTDTDYDAFLPELGVSQRWSDAVTASLFYKRGYRAGGAELSLVGRQNEYDPEFLDLVEFALRANPGRLVINANLYYGAWSDQQVDVQQSDNALDFLTENAGESEISGFELAVSYQPFKSWNVHGSVGFAHTEFTEFESAVQGDLSGNRFAGAPEWTANLGANYRFGRGWFVHGDVSFQSSAFATVENDPELVLEERTLLNLRGGWENERYSILAFIENVTDETYAVTAVRNVDDRLLGKVGAARQAGVQLSLRF